MDKVQSFIDRHNLGACSVDADKVLSLFRDEMKKGLSGSSSLAMIPTYVSTDAEIKEGESVIVLDAGGTNFRTCLVTFDENRSQGGG